MKTSIEYDLNRTFLIVEGNEIEFEEDYRHRMLAHNDISGIMPYQLRQIDEKNLIYFDVSEKISLLNYLLVHPVTRVEVRELLFAVYSITKETERYLIDATNILLTPEFIYKNVHTGKYEFACMPLKNTAHYLREALCSLLTFLLSHLDNSDEDLVSVMYAINDVLPYGNISPIMLYDLFEEGLSKQEKEREEKESSAEEKANSSVEELPEESPEPSNDKKLSFRDRHYVPSFAEICALALFIAGLAMVSYNIYMRLT